MHVLISWHVNLDAVGKIIGEEAKCKKGKLNEKIF